MIRPERSLLLWITGKRRLVPLELHRGLLELLISAILPVADDAFVESGSIPTVRIVAE